MGAQLTEGQVSTPEAVEQLPYDVQAIIMAKLAESELRDVLQFITKPQQAARTSIQEWVMKYAKFQSMMLSSDLFGHHMFSEKARKDEILENVQDYLEKTKRMVMETQNLIPRDIVIDILRGRFQPLAEFFKKVAYIINFGLFTKIEFRIDDTPHYIIMLIDFNMIDFYIPYDTCKHLFQGFNASVSTEDKINFFEAQMETKFPRMFSSFEIQCKETRGDGSPPPPHKLFRNWYYPDGGAFQVSITGYLQGDKVMKYSKTRRGLQNFDTNVKALLKIF
jgi:hypothetical protein